MQISSTTIIPAAAPEIWEVLTDYEDFATWNPFVTNVALDKNGKRARLRVDLDKHEREHAVEIKLHASHAPGKLAWDLLLAPSWLVSARYAATLQPHAEGAALTQEVRFGGLAKSSFIRAAFRKRVARGLEKMGEALREQMCGAR